MIPSQSCSLSWCFKMMWSKRFLPRLQSVPFSKYQCDFMGAQGDQRVTGVLLVVLLLTHCIHQLWISLYIPFPKWDRNTWEKLSFNQLSLHILKSSSPKPLKIPFALWVDLNVLFPSHCAVYPVLPTQHLQTAQLCAPPAQDEWVTLCGDRSWIQIPALMLFSSVGFGLVTEPLWLIVSSSIK